jgi:peptidoglycan/LPS O-acetylase OafA/YrhL
MMESFHVALLALTFIALISGWLVPRFESLPVLSESSSSDADAPRSARRSVAECMRGDDNFLLLRLIAASLVIYAHSYALSPRATHGDDLTSWLGIYSGSVAVYVFFFVSGFLVTGSWLRQRSLRAFLAARAIRIVPAYLACLAGGALIVGTVASARPAAEHLTDPLTWRYIYWNLTFPEGFQFNIPGVFDENRQQGINGSLWTLPAEVRAYALLAIFGLLGLLDRLPRLLLALLIGFWLVVFEGFRIPLVGVSDTLPMLGYFALGAVAWAARHALILDGRVVISLLIATAIGRESGAYAYLFALSLSYTCLWFAYGPRRLLGFNRFGDYSYGVYLWGFPMQQLVVNVIPSATPTLITLVAWPTALGCAMLSWHAIEKPTMQWRKRVALRHPAIEPVHTATQA